MKKAIKLLIAIILASIVLLTEAAELEGSFYIDGESIDCRVQNLTKTDIVIEGLKDEILSAKFYDKNGIEIPSENKYTPDIQLFQNWTRLLAASPDGINPGAVHRAIILFLNLPNKQRDAIDYMKFEIKVYKITSDKKLADEKRVVIKLKCKKAKIAE